MSLSLSPSPGRVLGYRIVDTRPMGTGRIFATRQQARSALRRRRAYRWMLPESRQAWPFMAAAPMIVPAYFNGTEPIIPSWSPTNLGGVLAVTRATPRNDSQWSTGDCLAFDARSLVERIDAAAEVGVDPWLDSRFAALRKLAVWCWEHDRDVLVSR